VNRQLRLTLFEGIATDGGLAGVPWETTTGRGVA
jgi:hypothetical protein